MPKSKPKPSGKPPRRISGPSHRASEPTAEANTSAPVAGDAALLPELTTITRTLHLVHHRNRNQHRVTKWWKPFCVFRRQVGKLTNDVEELRAAVDERDTWAAKGVALKPVSRAKLTAGQQEQELIKSRVDVADDMVRERARFLREFIVPKSYSGFTSLVADPQYAPLGLMLLGTLARVNRILETLDPETPTRDDDVREENASQAREIQHEHRDGEDLGEAISRDQIPATGVGDPDQQEKLSDHGRDRQLEIMEAEALSEPQQRGEKKKRTKEDLVRSDAVKESSDQDTPKPKKKKKRKKGDEFDNLFSGLL